MKKPSIKTVLILVVFVFFLINVFRAVSSGLEKARQAESKSQGEPLAKCLPAIAQTGQRQTKDLPDDSSGYQIHVVYAVPADGTDRHLDTDGTIATSVSAWQNWLCNQTGGHSFKLDTFQGKLDITYLKTAETNEQLLEAKEYESICSPSCLKGENLDRAISGQLFNTGLHSSHKLYITYFDGDSIISCGSASPGDLNYTSVYLLGHDNRQLQGGTPSCVVPFTTNYLLPEYFDMGMVHEIIHTLGFVPTCAPHFTNSGAFGGGPNPDPNDMIYGHASDSSTDLMSSEVNTGPSSKQVLDFNRDDYYDAHVKGCRDLKNSIFLDAGGKDLPPLADQWQ